MATITNKNNFLEFELDNETHLIAKNNIKFVRLDEFVAVVDDSERQRNNKRFLIKYSEVTNKDFNNGAEFYDWLIDLIGTQTPLEKDTDIIKNQTEELKEIKDLMFEAVKYLKKIYNPE